VIAGADTDDSPRAGAGATVGIGVDVGVSGVGATSVESFVLGARGVTFLGLGCETCRFLDVEFSFSCASG